MIINNKCMEQVFKELRYGFNILKSTIQCIKPSKLLKVLNIKNIDIKQFWNHDIKELSDRLWLPDKTNRFRKKDMDSWFKTIRLKNKNFSKKNKIKSVLSDKKISKSRNINIYPNLKQKKYLKKSIGSYRFFYNKTLNHIKENPPTKNYKKVKNGNYIFFEDEYMRVQCNGTHKLVYENLPSLYSLRKIIKQDSPTWVKIDNIDSHLIDQAINECCISFNTNLFKGKKFKMQYKSRMKNVRETINFESNAWSSKYNSFYTTKKRLGKCNMKSSEPFLNMKKLGSSLTYHRILHTWVLHVNYETESKKYINRNDMCALDPGVNKFMTMYSPKETIQFGKYSGKEITKKCKEMDIIQSKMTKCNHKKRQDLKMRLHCKIKKIKNMRNDLHWKVINYLTKTYNKIILPPFETKNMISNLCHKVSRQMNTLSFFTFKQRMKFKCQERDVELVIGNEAYTSRTCTRCGTLKKVQGETYKCNSCNLIVDRDVLGSRNIYLKYTI